jgi:hypothetical protein
MKHLPQRDAVRALREHPEAGKLLRSVEEWLHSGQERGRDSGASASSQTVNELLSPYLSMPAVPAGGAA